MRKQLGTIFLLLVLGCTFGMGQEYSPEDRYLESEIRTHRFDRNKWSETINGIDYDQKKENGRNRNYEEPADPGSGGGRFRRGGSTFMPGAGTAFAQFLLIAGGVILIALLIWSILGYGKAKNKKIKKESKEIDIRKIEENIHEADMDDYIRQAKDAKDFNLAVRLYYLAVLKELSLRKLIKWKVDKTNGEYLREMRAQADYQEFWALTRIFEQSWYGNRTLDAEAFAELEPRFTRFIRHQTSTAQAAATS